ncbi:MAG TPA: anti-sigma factor domain-containing protein, partial [Sporolactobacillaceae bacterium]|nr:anti-sigma factor domain-containing protein [Sporolactobacillaceae bacterium]
MSSGILMSKEGRQGVILTKDGTFETVRLPKDQKVRIGEEIHVRSSRVLRIPKSALSALAACLLLFAAVGAFGLGNQNKAVAAYVSFDINPSFEAGLNRDLHIVSVHSMNKDGSKLLSQIKDYKNLTLDEFTSKVAKTLDKDGYFNQQPQVVVSVTLTQASSNQNAKPLEAKITKALEPLNETPDFKSNKGVVQVIQTSLKTHEQAKKLGLTAGKYTLYKNAAKESQAVTADQAK